MYPSRLQSLDAPFERLHVVCLEISNRKLVCSGSTMRDAPSYPHHFAKQASNPSRCYILAGSGFTTIEHGIGIESYGCSARCYEIEGSRLR